MHLFAVQQGLIAKRPPPKFIYSLFLHEEWHLTLHIVPQTLVEITEGVQTLHFIFLDILFYFIY